MGETDLDIGMKAITALRSELKVILCIGETMIEHESKQTEAALERMLKAIEAELEPEQWKNVVIAYEPVWAIGTGKTPKPEEISKTHLMIRTWLSKNVNKQVA